jgi:hypothetical protein
MSLAPIYLQMTRCKVRSGLSVSFWNDHLDFGAIKSLYPQLFFLCQKNFVWSICFSFGMRAGPFFYLCPILLCSNYLIWRLLFPHLFSLLMVMMNGLLFGSLISSLAAKFTVSCKDPIQFLFCLNGCGSVVF